MSFLSVPDTYWAHPERPSGTGVLVLAGSSGRLDTGRADVLARAGATALAIRWFGGAGQPAVPREVPLETFVAAIDLLEPVCDRVGVLGLSYGAEAALLTAVRDGRIDAVVALAPTDVAWEGYREEDDDPSQGKWTWRGAPVPFVPIDQSWTPASSPPAFVESYLQSRRTADASTVAAATIPVEQFDGELVVVVGGDDQVWPSHDAAQAIVTRRAAHGLATTVVEDADAGHLVVLPGEPATGGGRPYLVGGDLGSAERLGRKAWPAIQKVFRLHCRRAREMAGLT
ncbi:MAG TPA: acyl-CoA thioester hydrolase/BAAT C-terminal domain-containing protein [Actinomycetales bacterium]|nr:acyl-CoA thioester hydrolase/BAAT C-terminal domain-containing protein [Actinomycetales bacterium]